VLLIANDEPEIGGA